MKKVLVCLVVSLLAFNIIAPFRYRSILNCKVAKNDVYLYVDKNIKIRMGWCTTEQCIIDLIKEQEDLIAQLEARYGDCE
jgi:hypothetical protein